MGKDTKESEATVVSRKARKFEDNNGEKMESENSNKADKMESKNSDNGDKMESKNTDNGDKMDSETTVKHEKRSLDSNGISSYSFKVKPGKVSQIINGNNPISVLNNLFSNLTYEVESVSGPAHCPKFVVSLKVKDIDKKFFGSGPSKKLSKYRAALSALSSILNVQNRTEGEGDTLMELEGDNASATLSNTDTILESAQVADNSVPGEDDAKSDKPTPAKRKKTEKTEVTLTDKNPVSILNELRAGLKYDVVSVDGPPHHPVFKVSVEVDGQKYVGTGASKKIARSQAAEEALKSFIQFPNNGSILSTTGAPRGNNADFTSDKVSDGKKSSSPGVLAPRDKNPVMLLNELYPNAVYEVTHNESDVVNRFKTVITIENETFLGTGSSKKHAKAAAAKIALAKLISYTPMDGMLNSQSEGGNKVSRDSLLKADGIGRLINEKFIEIIGGDIQHSRRKVLAGVVMTRGPTLDNAEVICVTSGTKCVSGGHICLNGSSLNDMHAEIIARRCCVNYFYDQLDLLLNPETATKSIFEKNPGGRGVKLTDGIEFHLYINTAPCGDARIFSPHEDNPCIDRHPNRVSRGQLRTKIESGEGTIPIKGSSIQTWDGIILGERLLTMSCSDKICKWNVLGLQGALLSHYVQPIYLKSIVLGGLMKEPHLYRAICGRIENTLQGLPPPYRLNRPEMLKVSSIEMRQAQKAPNFAVIWMDGMEKPEVVSTEKGKPETGVSFVCKQRLAERFFNLSGKLSGIRDDKIAMTSYAEAKESVKTCVAARRALYEAFKKAQLGSWVTKPLEQDLFEFPSL